MRFTLLVLASLALVGCGHGPCPDPETAPSEDERTEADGLDHGHLDGVPHAFDDPERWAARWDTEARDRWQKPDAVIDKLELGVDMVVADIGAGTGYFAVRLAEAVPAGHVWAVDVEPSMVRHINDRAREAGLDNLFGIMGRPDDPLLPELADMVLMVNTYHHVSDRTAYFENLRDQLTPLGRVAIVDFKMGELPVGPPEEVKISPDDATQELEQAGYTVVEVDRDLLPHQYVIIAEPTS